MEAATRAASVVLLLALAGVTAGCAGGSTFDVQNPSAPTISSAVGIAFQPAPPSTLAVSGVSPVSTSITAVVSNDASNAGIDWVLSCGSASDCGQLNPLHTTSGSPVSYIPPVTLFPSTNNQPVNIVAYATADHNKNAVAPIVVTAYGSVLQGTYVLQTTGVDSSGGPFQRAGVVVLDGNGNVTSGEQTANYTNPSRGTLSSVSDVITGGSYFVGPDGRGTLTVTTSDTNLGQQGLETYAISVLSRSEALITKMDFLNTQVGVNNESSVGTLNLQTSAAAPSKGYAFVARGVDITGSPIAVGGILNIDSPGAISGTGSNFDLVRNDGSGTVNSSTTVTGTISAPDALGTVTISLATDFGALQFTGYTVDATHIQLIESDDRSGAGFGVMAGMAIGQGASTGTFTAANSLTGRFVFGMSGQDLGGLQNSLAAAGTFTANSSAGTLGGGFLDETQNSVLLGINTGFHANYAVDPAGSGRVTTNSFAFTAVANGTGSNWVFYLVGNGMPMLILDADTEPSFRGGTEIGGGVATGIAYPAPKVGTFGGSYGVSITENFGGGEADGTGQITVDSAAETLSGVLDANVFFVPTLGTEGEPNLTDGFQPTTLAVRLSGTLFGPESLDVAADYFLIDSNHGFFIETDGDVNGANPGGLTFGYFATRTPVCAGCP